MNNIDNSIVMDDSVVHVSSNLIDVIDLTKETPPESARQPRLRRRNLQSTSYNCNLTNDSNRQRNNRPLIPRILGDTHFENTGRSILARAREESPISFWNQILNLDDTLVLDEIENDETGYTVESNNKKEPIPLTCPVCLEMLTSNRQPITTHCGHLFCTECLKSSINISTKCPTCKRTITLKSCTRLYF